jgi:hypothetical protein
MSTPRSRDDWNFAAVGTDSHHIPHFVGFAKTHEGALKLQKSAIALGWANSAIFDTNLQKAHE